MHLYTCVHRSQGDFLCDCRGENIPSAHSFRAHSITSSRQHTGTLRHDLEKSHVSAPCLRRRDGCQCVICKQARRTGKAWVGMDGKPRAPGGAPSSAPPGALRPAAPAGTRRLGGPTRNSAVGPRPRVGKRAFLEAMPHLPAGNRITPVRAPPATVLVAVRYHPSVTRRLWIMCLHTKAISRTEARRFKCCSSMIRHDKMYMCSEGSNAFSLTTACWMLPCNLRQFQRAGLRASRRACSR